MEHPELDHTAAQIQSLTDKIEGLEEALLSRDVIGQAKGILMERFHLTSDQAFEELRKISQHYNRKVKELSAELAETGEWPLPSNNGNGDGNGNSPQH